MLRLHSLCARPSVRATASISSATGLLPSVLSPLSRGVSSSSSSSNQRQRMQQLLNGPPLSVQPAPVIKHKSEGKRSKSAAVAKQQLSSVEGATTATHSTQLNRSHAEGKQLSAVGDHQQTNNAPTDAALLSKTPEMILSDQPVASALPSDVAPSELTTEEEAELDAAIASSVDGIDVGKVSAEVLANELLREQEWEKKDKELRASEASEEKELRARRIRESRAVQTSAIPPLWTLAGQTVGQQAAWPPFVGFWPLARPPALPDRTFGFGTPLDSFTACRDFTYFGPADPSLVSKAQLQPIPLEFARWMHVQQEQIRAEQEQERFEISINEQHIANRCHTYFGSEDHDEMDQTALEACRRGFKMESDREVLRAAAFQVMHVRRAKRHAKRLAAHAKRLAERTAALQKASDAAVAAMKAEAETRSDAAIDAALAEQARVAAEQLARVLEAAAAEAAVEAAEVEQEAAAEAKLQTLARQPPCLNPDDVGLDKRGARESTSDEEVQFYAITQEQLESDEPRFGLWKDLATLEPTTQQTPGIYELAVWLPGAAMPTAVYLGYSLYIRDQRWLNVFAPLQRWVRLQDQFESRIYMRAMIVDGADRSQLQKIKEAILTKVNYFANPFGQLVMRTQLIGAEETCHSEMQLAFGTVSNYRERLTSHRRATIIGEAVQSKYRKKQAEPMMMLAVGVTRTDLEIDQRSSESTLIDKDPQIELELDAAESTTGARSKTQ